ncbi:MAG TPA: hypothetical protein VF755_14215 [Catenuloplanes sp.]|jgi:hypothetical protein
MLEQGRARARRIRLAAAALTGVVAVSVALVVVNSAVRAGDGGRPAADAPARDLAADEADLLYRAEQALVVRCMRQRGFEYQANVRDRSLEPREFPYVVDDLGWARQHGYGRELERRLEAAADADPNEKRFKQLAPDRRAAALDALNGAPTKDPAVMLTARLPSGAVLHRNGRSCTSQAQQDLYGDLARWYQVSLATDDMVGLRYAMVHEDARFTAATAAWSRCMRQAGYQVDKPGQAQESVPRSAEPAVRQQEIRTAVAEAECANSTPLAATARELDDHYRQVVRDQYPADFADWRRLRVAALPRAHAVDAQA